MKKNKALRIAAALLVVVAITTCGMTGALAKYVDNFNVEGTAVRAGLFKVVGPGNAVELIEAATDNFLFEGNGVDPEGHALKYANSSMNIIVPGSVIKVKGFPIVNLSEVDVLVKITSLALAINGTAAATMPLYFSAGPTGVAGAFVAGDWVKIEAGNMTAISNALVPTAGEVLKNFPAKAARVAPATWDTNELRLEDFYILWPFDKTTPGTATHIDPLVSDNEDTVYVTRYIHDGICGSLNTITNADDSGGCKQEPLCTGTYQELIGGDTLIGVQQAETLLITQYSHAATCATTPKTANDPIVNGTCITGATGCKELPNTFVDVVPTRHNLQIAVGLSATQID